MIREPLQNSLGILKTLLVLLRFIELDHVFEEIGFLFGEGTALAGLGIVVVGHFDVVEWSGALIRSCGWGGSSQQCNAIDATTTMVILEASARGWK